MLKYLIFYALAAATGLAMPVVQQHSDLASHLVIVTPQAQVHLEPASKLGPATTFIHHLSPLARIGAPHDETIVYVPASGPAPIISIDSPIQSAIQTVQLGRSGGLSEKELALQFNSQTKQNPITSGIQQAQTVSSMASMQAQDFGNAVNEGFTQAASALSPENFFPLPSSNKNDALILEKKGEEALLPAGARRFYAIAAAPAVQHVVDFVHGPVLLGPVSAIRARSIQEQANAPALALESPQEIKAESLQSQSDVKAELQDAIPEPAEKETKPLEKQQPALQQPTDFGRFLEANALKEELKEELKPQLEYKKEGIQSEKLEQELAASDSILENQPLSQTAIANEKIQLKSVPHVGSEVGVDAGVIAQNKQDEAVVVADKVA